ncbi:hypothetical protein KC352_g45330, partial [Hortaea werneckii]
KEAVHAASQAIYGTPTTAAAISSINSAISSLNTQASSATVGAAAQASSRYSAAISQASKHYEDAKSRVSAQVSGTPEPVHKQMFSSVEQAYSDSIAAASQGLDDAVEGIQGALHTPAAGGLGETFGMTQGPYQSMSSIASSRLSEGLGHASEQYHSAKQAVGAEPTPAHQAYMASAQAVYYQGIGMAHDRYSSFLEQASSAMATPSTAGYEAYIAAA